MRNQKKDLIRSPLHYNGNKYSLLNQILPVISKHKYSMIIEPFGGTGIVSINSNIENIWINDINHQLVSILQYIKEISLDEIKRLINITDECSLTSDVNEKALVRKNNGTKGYSELNKIGYKTLMEMHRASMDDPSVMFLLSNYSFNRMIRFNSSGVFNVPVGKGDFSKKQIEHTQSYSEALKLKNAKITCWDYKKVIASNRLSKNTLFYFDPPYLNGSAQYNQFWNLDDEINLYREIDALNARGFDFCVSNTVYLNGMKNEILEKWSKKYKVIAIQKNYSKTSYNKKERYDAQEILVTNIR